MLHSFPEALADLLERHEETGNAQAALSIGGEVWERADALVFSSRPEFGSGLNFACRIRSDESGIESLLDAVTPWFQRRQVAPHVRVSPLTRPTDVAERLAERGFVKTEAETQMVLATLDVEQPSNPRIAVEQVDLEHIPGWLAIQDRGFGGTGEPTPLILEMARAGVRQGRSTPYLARFNGTPAGAATLFEWAGVFGIYGVATASEFRYRGIGTALVRHMITQARSRGDFPICLQVETGSPTQAWYERLGFRVVYDRTGWTLGKGQG